MCAHAVTIMAFTVAFTWMEIECATSFLTLCPFFNFLGLRSVSHESQHALALAANVYVKCINNKNPTMANTYIQVKT